MDVSLRESGVGSMRTDYFDVSVSAFCLTAKTQKADSRSAFK